MEIANRRSEFSVFLIDRDPQAAKPYMESARAMGYEDLRLFPNLDAALAMAHQQLPHIIVVNYEAFETSIERFLMDINSLSPEMLVVAIVPSNLQLEAMQFVAKGLIYDTVVAPLISTIALVQAVDRAASRLYFQFESEQLREHYQALGLTDDSSGKHSGVFVFEANENLQKLALDPDKTTGRNVSAALEINRALERFLLNKELEPTIQIFMDTASKIAHDTPILYFKYVASHMTLMFSQATHLPVEKLRGMGLDLKKEDPTSIREGFKNPEQMSALKGLVKEVFKKDTYTAFTHFNDDEAIGIFVMLGETDLNDDESQARQLRAIFELAYKRNVTLKEKHSLDTKDAASGVYNRKYFSKLLDDEMARSRRLFMPLSLLILNVDQDLSQKLGLQESETVLKTVAQILKKTTRANDIVARLGSYEFACLLPHTPYEGASIKAERLRRMIENTRIPLIESFGIKNLTVSTGVSEYPSFSSDVEMLVRSADEAMHIVKDQGGNKICLAEAPKGFTPDFQPREVHPSPDLGSKQGAR